MDYNIKVKYEQTGKRAAGVRQQAVKAAQKAAQRGPGKAGQQRGTVAQQSVRQMKTLTTSIDKLIVSNRKLENAIRSQSGGGGGPIRPGPLRRGAPRGASRLFGGAAGFGRMGASIPVIGAGIAALGFTIQKVNQIGNAYIELAGQQLKSVGVGGFRGGRGMFTGAELGAGMKAFSMATGEFLDLSKKSKKERKKEQVALKPTLDYTTIFGLSPEQALGQRGLFKRAGAERGYTRTVEQAAGMGIQTELPTLMGAVAGQLEEAVKNGVNSSSIANDMGREVASLTLATNTKSVDAAMNIIRGFKGVKTQLGRGKLGSLEGMFAAKATREMLMERVTDISKVDILDKEGKRIGETTGRERYLSRLQKEGVISKAQREKMLNLGPGATFEDIQRTIGGAGALTLFKKQALEANPATMMRRTIQQVQKTYGATPEGFQRFSAVADQMGWSGNVEQLRAVWQTGLRGEPKDVEGVGRKIISERAKGVKKSAAGMARRRQIRREDLVMTYGDSFARSAENMEVAMINLAKTTLPFANEGIKTLGTVTGELAKGMGELVKLSKEVSKEGGVGGYIGTAIGQAIKDTLPAWMGGTPKKKKTENLTE